MIVDRDNIIRYIDKLLHALANRVFSLMTLRPDCLACLRI